jgi:UDP-glucose 4-epimerase
VTGPTDGVRRRIAITGAAGYIGSQLGRHLAAQHDVLGLDVHARSDVGFRLRTIDIRDRALTALLRDERIDAVVHLAAVMEPSGDRARDHAIDVQGTEHVLASCVSAGVRHITVTSSGAAYGYHADNPAWIDESQPLRGNPEFSYADHKRQVEEQLARYRQMAPQLGQLIFRVCTVLGAGTSNQITALFHKSRLLAVRGARSPFVFVWDGDVVAAIAHGVTTGITGIYNLAGDGALSMDEIGYHLRKSVLHVPASVLTAVLAVGHRVGLTRYGPEQVRFLRYRPVLSNAHLRAAFGWQPSRTSREALQLFAEAQGLGWRP